jgi:hypothetical protein
LPHLHNWTKTALFLIKNFRLILKVTYIIYMNFKWGNLYFYIFCLHFYISEIVINKIKNPLFDFQHDCLCKLTFFFNSIVNFIQNNSTCIYSKMSNIKFAKRLQDLKGTYIFQFNCGMQLTKLHGLPYLHNFLSVSIL